MKRRYETIYSPALNRDMDVLAFGHFGAPVIAFPSGGGQYFDFESNGMIGALAPLIEGGKIKIYCPPSADRESWLNKSADYGHRAYVHNLYQDFLVNNLVPAIRADCNNPEARVALVGCSIGAFHAANFALKFPHLFHYALCMSGRYDLPSLIGGRRRQHGRLFQQPAGLRAEHARGGTRFRAPDASRAGGGARGLGRPLHHRNARAGGRTGVKRHQPRARHLGV